MFQTEKNKTWKFGGLPVSLLWIYYTSRKIELKTGAIQIVSIIFLLEPEQELFRCIPIETKCISRWYSRCPIFYIVSTTWVIGHDTVTVQIIAPMWQCHSYQFLLWHNEKKPHHFSNLFIQYDNECVWKMWYTTLWKQKRKNSFIQCHIPFNHIQF